MQLRTGAVAALLAVLLLGCGGDGEQEGDTETAAPAPQPVARVVSLSDAEALAVLGAVHTGATQFASAALDSVENADLRRLLRVVRTDHEALQRELGAIADSLKVTPAATHEAAERVRTAAQQAQRATTGAVDDGAVLQSEIALQETLLAVFDSTVLPGTRQPLLARYAAAVRPTLSAHQQRARQVEQLLRDEAAARAARRAAAASPPSTTTRPSGITPARPQESTPQRQQPTPPVPRPEPQEPTPQPPPDTTGQRTPPPDTSAERTPADTVAG